jgi:hypothetical protein
LALCPFSISEKFLLELHETDRHQETGGSIANINADGTFTHVEEVDPDEF